MATLVLTLSLGSAAFAATDVAGSQTTTTSASANAQSTTGKAGGMRHGAPRTDETALTGDVLTKVTAAAQAKVGNDATVIRAETDADGNAAYEVHMKKADGTCVTVYVDESYKVVSVETNDRAAGGKGMRHGGRHGSCAGQTGTDATLNTGSAGSTSSNTSV